MNILRDLEFTKELLFRRGKAWAPAWFICEFLILRIWGSIITNLIFIKDCNKNVIIVVGIVARIFFGGGIHSVHRLIQWILPGLNDERPPWAWSPIFGMVVPFYEFYKRYLAISEILSFKPIFGAEKVKILTFFRKVPIFLTSGPQKGQKFQSQKFPSNVCMTH